MLLSKTLKFSNLVQKRLSEHSHDKQTEHADMLAHGDNVIDAKLMHENTAIKTHSVMLITRTLRLAVGCV